MEYWLLLLLGCASCGYVDHFCYYDLYLHLRGHGHVRGEDDDDDQLSLLITTHQFEVVENKAISETKLMQHVKSWTSIFFVYGYFIELSSFKPLNLIAVNLEQ